MSDRERDIRRSEDARHSSLLGQCRTGIELSYVHWRMEGYLAQLKVNF